ncbi:MAG: bifunctional 4-hydroxy-2-oxoglutarate aldolase/2-dehydro-3-deoxy-phosphogluconate aldolase, partial [Xenococcaceae cyanobacterium]
CKESWQNLLIKYRAIAVIRADRKDLAIATAKAVANGGMKLIEITWNSDRPAESIEQIRLQLPDCIVGAGTILNASQLAEAIAAGAQFIFSPHTDLQLLATAISKYQVPYIPGALTPTEIVTAWQAGASCVKVYPIETMGGASYLKNLQGPLGHIPLIPTGGVTIDNAKQMLEAGAIAVGLSSHLISPSLVANEDWDAIAKRVKNLLARLNLN